MSQKQQQMYETKSNVSKTAYEAAQPSCQIVASNDDLLTEILLRLPLKPLIRFKLVSKQWQTLISGPEFITLRNPNPRPAIGLFLSCFDFCDNWFEYVPFSVKTQTNPPFRELNFTKDSWGITISHSCNGLLLCSSWACSHSRYYVYNPTTKKFATLPNLIDGGGSPVCTKNVEGMSLAFDPFKSPHYRVVCVRLLILVQLNREEFQYQCEVYSSEMGRWRKCYGPFKAHVDFENGVYWNGAIHWISRRSTADSLYFNLDDRTVRIMPMPSIPDGWDRKRERKYYLGESCDHLHFIEIFRPQIEFNVYEMKRDYSEWFVKYKVGLSPVVCVNSGMIRDNYEPTHEYHYNYSISTLVCGEKEEDSFLILQTCERAIRYNIVDQTFETVWEFEDDVDADVPRFLGTHGFQYIESLCCV